MLRFGAIDEPQPAPLLAKDDNLPAGGRAVETREALEERIIGEYKNALKLLHQYPDSKQAKKLAREKLHSLYAELARYQEQTDDVAQQVAPSGEELGSEAGNDQGRSSHPIERMLWEEITLYNTSRNLAEIYFGDSDYEKALEFYSMAVNYRADDPVIWMRMGISASQLGKLELAKAAFESALELRPEFIPCKEALSIIDFALSSHQFSNCADPSVPDRLSLSLAGHRNQSINLGQLKRQKAAVLLERSIKRQRIERAAQNATMNLPQSLPMNHMALSRNATWNSFFNITFKEIESRKLQNDVSLCHPFRVSYKDKKLEESNVEVVEEFIVAKPSVTTIVIPDDSDAANEEAENDQHEDEVDARQGSRDHTRHHQSSLGFDFLRGEPRRVTRRHGKDNLETTEVAAASAGGILANDTSEKPESQDIFDSLLSFLSNNQSPSRYSFDGVADFSNGASEKLVENSSVCNDRERTRSRYRSCTTQVPQSESTNCSPAYLVCTCSTCIAGMSGPTNNDSLHEFLGARKNGDDPFSLMCAAMNYLSNNALLQRGTVLRSETFLSAFRTVRPFVDIHQTLSNSTLVSVAELLIAGVVESGNNEDSRLLSSSATSASGGILVKSLDPKIRQTLSDIRIILSRVPSCGSLSGFVSGHLEDGAFDNVECLREAILSSMLVFRSEWLRSIMFEMEELYGQASESYQSLQALAEQMEPLCEIVCTEIIDKTSKADRALGLESADLNSVRSSTRTMDLFPRNDFLNTMISEYRTCLKNIRERVDGKLLGLDELAELEAAKLAFQEDRFDSVVHLLAPSVKAIATASIIRSRHLPRIRMLGAACEKLQDFPGSLLCRALELQLAVVEILDDSAPGRRKRKSGRDMVSISSQDLVAITSPLKRLCTRVKELTLADTESASQDPNGTGASGWCPVDSLRIAARVVSYTIGHLFDVLLPSIKATNAASGLVSVVNTQKQLLNAFSRALLAYCRCIWYCNIRPDENSEHEKSSLSVGLQAVHYGLQLLVRLGVDPITESFSITTFKFYTTSLIKYMDRLRRSQTGLESTVSMDGHRKPLARNRHQGNLIAGVEDVRSMPLTPGKVVRTETQSDGSESTESSDEGSNPWTDLQACERELLICYQCMYGLKPFAKESEFKDHWLVQACKGTHHIQVGATGVLSSPPFVSISGDENPTANANLGSSVNTAVAPTAEDLIPLDNKVSMQNDVNNGEELVTLNLATKGRTSLPPFDSKMVLSVYRLSQKDIHESIYASVPKSRRVRDYLTRMSDALLEDGQLAALGVPMIPFGRLKALLEKDHFSASNATEEIRRLCEEAPDFGYSNEESKLCHEILILTAISKVKPVEMEYKRRREVEKRSMQVINVRDEYAASLKYAQAAVSLKPRSASAWALLGNLMRECADAWLDLNLLLGKLDSRDCEEPKLVLGEAQLALEVSSRLFYEESSKSPNGVYVGPCELDSAYYIGILSGSIEKLSWSKVNIWLCESLIAALFLRIQDLKHSVPTGTISASVLTSELSRDGQTCSNILTDSLNAISAKAIEVIDHTLGLHRQVVATGSENSVYQPTSLLPNHLVGLPVHCWVLYLLRGKILAKHLGLSVDVFMSFWDAYRLAKSAAHGDGKTLNQLLVTEPSYRLHATRLKILLHMKIEKKLDPSTLRQLDVLPDDPRGKAAMIQPFGEPATAEHALSSACLQLDLGSADEEHRLLFAKLAIQSIQALREDCRLKQGIFQYYYKSAFHVAKCLWKLFERPAEALDAFKLLFKEDLTERTYLWLMWNYRYIEVPYGFALLETERKFVYWRHKSLRAYINILAEQKDSGTLWSLFSRLSKRFSDDTVSDSLLLHCIRKYVSVYDIAGEDRAATNNEEVSGVDQILNLSIQRVWKVYCSACTIRKSKQTTEECERILHTAYLDYLKECDASDGSSGSYRERLLRLQASHSGVHGTYVLESLRFYRKRWGGLSDSKLHVIANRLQKNLESSEKRGVSPSTGDLKSNALNDSPVGKSSVTFRDLASGLESRPTLLKSSHGSKKVHADQNFRMDELGVKAENEKRSVKSVPEGQAVLRELERVEQSAGQFEVINLD